MNGGDALVDALLALGVDTGFTVPGESFLNVLEALRVKRDSFRLVSTRHESGGAFAAEAYGKLSGRPAAVFVSRGPGATNAAIGIHTARQSSTPLLLFVGHVRTRSKGREAFQEIDHHRMFAPVAKAVMEPESAADIQRVTGQAVHESMAGRPGPVVVVLPRDITEAPVDDALPAARVDTRQPRAPAESIQAALDAVSAEIPDGLSKLRHSDPTEVVAKLGEHRIGVVFGSQTIGPVTLTPQRLGDQQRIAAPAGDQAHFGSLGFACL